MLTRKVNNAILGIIKELISNKPISNTAREVIPKFYNE